MDQPANIHVSCLKFIAREQTVSLQGVMLTHSNVLHCIAAQEAVQELSEGVEPPGQDERYLSWLPLAHIMVTIFRLPPALSI